MLFDHVTIRVSDRAESVEFYSTLLRTLGIEPTAEGDEFVEWNDFSLAQATTDKAPTRRLHVAFGAPSRDAVDEFWRVGTQAGYRDDGAPGPRPQYSESYYGAFLLDPDGNSAEAVTHDSSTRGVDHLWIRVADVAAAKAFYDQVAPFADFRPGYDSTERAGFSGDRGSFSLVAGVPTEHLHMAFLVADDSTVDAFHRALVAAGYRNNGEPGERRVYHAGYYGAFVLDPDGNNIELVNHNRDRP